MGLKGGTHDYYFKLLKDAILEKSGEIKINFTSNE